MTCVSALIGDTIINKTGQTLSSSSLYNDGTENPVLGLYFSAHWCPPCREFTPVLVQFYERFKATPSGHRFEIVFVSSDYDENAFNQYIDEMPWNSIPFQDKEHKDSLFEKFRVQGVPLLVIIDAVTGSVITKSGRNCVVDDPDGYEFPWIPDPLPTLLSRGQLLNGTDEVSSAEALTGKVKGLYFSAQWCPPCRVFTPDLLKAYHTLKAEGRNFEVVYVSWDRSLDSFKEYYETMPWLAIPFQDSRIMKLAKHFNVKGIPLLVLVDENDELITTDGRNVVSSDTEGKNFPWVCPPIEELSEYNAPALNESACMVLFTGGNVELLTMALPFLSDVAQQYTEQQKKSSKTQTPLPKLSFFYEGPTGAEVAEQLRTFVFSNGTLGAESPHMCVAILDIPGQRVYARNDDAVAKLFMDSVALRGLLDDYSSGRLPFVPFHTALFNQDM